MPAQLVTATGFIIAAVAAGLSLYYWRRSTGLYALLVESANRFEELRQRNSQLEQTLGKADEKFKQQRESTQRLSLGLEEAREKTAELTTRLEAKEHEARYIAEKLELQKGHLEKQLAKAQDMLRVTEEQRLQAFAEAEALRQDLQNAKQTAYAKEAAFSQELMTRDNEWANKLRDAERNKDVAEKKAKTSEALELRRVKRKVAQYERLYSGMKGLREMSDERNRNWEVALRKLAEWILKETGKEPTALAIGPLVGQALHTIGAQLIDDNEGADPRGGAERGGPEGDELPELERVGASEDKP